MMTRRGFVRTCASLLAAIKASPGVYAGAQAKPYRRVKLVDDEQRPISPAWLEVGENYLFHYPYISTPCFLLRLGHPLAGGTVLATEEGESYRWEGGVGPNRSVVAFSAICAHKLTHPARAVSFINYRHESVSFLDRRERATRQGEIIYCCSEKSVYDVARGGRVLGGPAPQPLAAIRLEHDAGEASLYATGTYGGELFDEFFEKFGFRLALEFETTDIQRLTTGEATVMRLDEYCRNQVLC